MKITLKDLVVGVLALLGIIGSINWIEIPFWIYILLIVAYAGLRLAKKEDNSLDDNVFARETGGELSDDDDPNGPI